MVYSVLWFCNCWHKYFAAFELGVKNNQDLLRILHSYLSNSRVSIYIIVLFFTRGVLNELFATNTSLRTVQRIWTWF